MDNIIPESWNFRPNEEPRKGLSKKNADDERWDGTWLREFSEVTGKIKTPEDVKQLYFVLSQRAECCLPETVGALLRALHPYAKRHSVPLKEIKHRHAPERVVRVSGVTDEQGAHKGKIVYSLTNGGNDGKGD